MRKNFLFRSLILAFVIAAGGLLLYSCDKNEPVVDRTVCSDCDDVSAETRSSRGFQWDCRNCSRANAVWRDLCSNCGTQYSSSYGNYVMTLWRYIVNTVREVGGGTIGDHNINGRVQLPNGNFPAYAPDPWYEGSVAMRYYNELKNSSAYRLTPGYAEGVEYAWYHTTHILYPNLHNKVRIESDYDKFILREGANLTGSEGQGIKDAGKAAVKAFVETRF